MILVDWSLPDMVGPKVVDQIKTDDKLKHIPVMLLMGKVDPLKPIEWKFEPDAFMHKPVHVPDFLECVQQLLNIDG